MSARIRFLIFIAALGMLAPAAGQAFQDQDWSARLEAAASQADSGAVADAEKAYRLALQQAAGPQQRAETALALAKLLAASPPGTANEEPNQLYKLATREATGKLRVEAHNSYGVFLLRQGEAEKAVSVLSAVRQDLEEIDPAGQSRFLFNYGTALERSGESSQATEAYLESVDLDPGFAPACEAAFRLVQGQGGWDSGPAMDVERMTALVERLLGAGELEVVQTYLEESLESRPEADPELVILLARYLTVARIAPDSPRRPARSERFILALTKRRMELLERAYGRELPLLLDPAEGKAFASVWQGSESASKAYSGVLLMLGDWYLRKGEPAAALPRYALAWSSAENLDAAVQLASLLAARRAHVDPDGQVLDRLVSILFGGKGNAYLRGDWANILRFHTVLATIFEGQGKWGPSSDPRSAVFQWEHALAAHRRLQGSASGQKDAPGLHARLGTAYQAVGREDEALSQFLTAGEQYVELKRPELAEPVLLRAQDLTPRAGEEDRGRIAALSTAVKQSGDRKLTSDSDITAQLQAKFAADPEIRRGDLKITTVKGVVTVSGTLRRAGKEKDIESLVLATEGVSRVKTEVEVAVPPL